jgi:hypothetical protein
VIASDDQQARSLTVLLVDVAVGKGGIESRAPCVGTVAAGRKVAALVRGFGRGGGCPVVVELEQVVAAPG